MNQRLSEQVAKILALVDSEHEGESAGAVRMARQMLAREGLCFGDLARLASRSFTMSASSSFSPSEIEKEGRILRLQEQIQTLLTERDSFSSQAELMRRRILELEQRLTLSETEAKRWKDMAREAIEKMWDIGSRVGIHEDALSSLAETEDTKRRAAAGRYSRSQ